MRNNQLINDMKKQYSTIMMLAMMVAALSLPLAVVMMMLIMEVVMLPLSECGNVQT